MEVIDIMDASRIHQGGYILIFRSLPFWKVVQLLCVSRASTWSLRGRWWFLRAVLVVFDRIYAPWIYQGSFILIFRYIPSKKVVKILGSPERPPSVILGV